MRTLSIKEAEVLASKFRFENGLSQSEPLNTKTLIRRLEITAIYRPLSETSCGISCKASSGQKFMLINSNSTRGRQHFTIAHELYHLFYDPAPIPHMCALGPATGEEKNANRFASCLLMPQEGVISLLRPQEIASHDVTLAGVLRMEQLFGVSRNTLLIRLKDLGLITSGRLKDLMGLSVKDTARQYGYDLSLYEPGNEGLVIGDFGEKARILYEMGRISEGHYMELLNMLHDGRA